jgi:hypothetical protein
MAPMLDLLRPSRPIPHPPRLLNPNSANTRLTPALLGPFSHAPARSSLAAKCLFGEEGDGAEVVWVAELSGLYVLSFPARNREANSRSSPADISATTRFRGYILDPTQCTLSLARSSVSPVDSLREQAPLLPFRISTLANCPSMNGRSSLTHSASGPTHRSNVRNWLCARRSFTILPLLSSLCD